MSDESQARLSRSISVSERRRQIPAAEETDSWDPYHHPWSGVVANTPRWGLRVLGGVGGDSGLFQGVRGGIDRCSGVCGGGYGVGLAATAGSGPV